MSDDKLLHDIPAIVDPPAVTAWASMAAEPLSMLSLVPGSFTDRWLGMPGIDQADQDRLVNAALLADWACYAEPADRADYPRLRAVMTTFPRGFRLFFCCAADGWVPVAYTGWYPLGAAAFTKAHDDPAALTHRRELWPLPTLSTEGDYVWLFNYCIVPVLRRTPESRHMLQTYAADLRAMRCLGLAAAVLSPESKRVAGRFGMTHTGDMTHDGVTENVYAVRFE